MHRLGTSITEKTSGTIIILIIVCTGLTASLFSFTFGSLLPLSPLNTQQLGQICLENTDRKFHKKSKEKSSIKTGFKIKNQFWVLVLVAPLISLNTGLTSY
jgi:hypothetical protein